MSLDEFRDAYWDGRVFGNTFLEEGDKGRFITTRSRTDWSRN